MDWSQEKRKLLLRKVERPPDFYRVVTMEIKERRNNNGEL